MRVVDLDELIRSFAALLDSQRHRDALLFEILLSGSFVSDDCRVVSHDAAINVDAAPARDVATLNTWVDAIVAS